MGRTWKNTRGGRGSWVFQSCCLRLSTLRLGCSLLLSPRVSSLLKIVAQRPENILGDEDGKVVCVALRRLFFLP